MLKNSISKTGHQRARPWGGWLRAAALTAGVALASTAHAGVDAGATIPGTQSGTVSVVAPTRTATLRTNATKVQWISHKDCTDDIQLTFNPVVTSPSSAKVLSAFVSNSVDDCLQNSTRNDPVRCKHLAVTSGTESLGQPLVTFKASDLTELMGITSCGDDEADGGTSTAPRSLKYYFFLSPPQQDLLAGTDNFAIYADSGIDLWGPPPPTSVKAESGDETLQITFTDGSNNDSDRLGYYVYVDDGTLTVDGGTPASSTTSGAGTTTSVGAAAGAGGGTSTTVTSSSGSASASSTGGGAGGTGGAGGAGGATSSASSSSTSATTSASSSTSATTGAGTTTATTTTTGGSSLSTGVTSGGNTDACNATSAVASCVAASLALVAGEIPGDTTQNVVETGTATAAVGNLKNGKAYVIAMAAYDDVGNLGKLSDLACGTPAPVDSILRVYQCKGGLTESGCGFCSVGGERGGSFAALVSAGLVVFGLAARRSRRPRAVRASRGAR